MHGNALDYVQKLNTHPQYSIKDHLEIYSKNDKKEKKTLRLISIPSISKICENIQKKQKSESQKQNISINNFLFQIKHNSVAFILKLILWLELFHYAFRFFPFDVFVSFFFFFFKKIEGLILRIEIYCPCRFNGIMIGTRTGRVII